MVSPRRLPGLDGLRGVSILLVIVGHLSYSNGHPPWLFPSLAIALRPSWNPDLRLPSGTTPIVIGCLLALGFGGQEEQAAVCPIPRPSSTPHFCLSGALRALPAGPSGTYHVRLSRHA